MPYDIMKDGEQFCLVKKDTGKRVPGGCHPSEAEAKRHMMAILASEHAGVEWIDIETMRSFCPECADKMTAKGLDRVRVDFAEHTYHMPKMERCIQHLKEKGFDAGSAHAICYATLGDEANMTANTSTFLIDNYVATHPGEAYRLFPFGKIVKNGKTRDLTPTWAATVKLPHFKPPIKLGSHDETTPAGGHITGLEVRVDGLYAIPEVTDKGAQALADGAYRYHSPEVIFDEDGGFEDPQTGEMIRGPLIVGDALLHTPHLGEATALYSVEPIKSKDGGDPMTVESIDKNALELFWGRVKKMWEKADAPSDTPELPEEFKAQLVQAEQYKAELIALKAETAQKARVETFAAQLKDAGLIEGAEHLAAMPDTASAWVLQQFKALTAQIKANDKLTQALGNDTPAPESPAIALDAAVKAKMTEKGLDYIQAFEAVRVEKPDLFK